MMKHLKPGIKTLYFFSFFGTALFYCALLTGLFYAWATSSLLRQERALFQERAENAMQMTENTLQNLHSVSQNFGFSELSQEYLFDYFQLSTSDESISSISKLFTALNGTNYYAHHITIYDLSGNSISVGVYSGTSRVDLTQLDWIELVKNGPGRAVSRPYSTNAFSSSADSYKWYLSIYRPLLTKFGTLAGYTETVQSCKTIFLDIISGSKTDADARTLVFDADGVLIYPFEHVMDDDLEQAGYYWNLISEQDFSGLTGNPYTGIEELVVSEHSTASGWSYVCVEPSRVIFSSLGSFRTMTAVVIILSILISFLLSYLTTRRLTKPIHTLLTRVRKTGLETLGEPELEPIHFSVKELEELNQAYSETTSRLKESLDRLLESQSRERKSQRFALQFQINPHFYYNSLSSIMILAEEGETDSIISVSQNLSQILHYATKSSPMVSLTDELDYIKKYLYCLKIRYQSSFSYELQVADEMLPIQIPRLIIQPLIENCMKYGNNCPPPWKIAVRCEYTDKDYRICVSDNGPGFTDEALKRINDQIRHYDETKEIPELEIHGMGLLNVYLRWKLAYQERAFFLCENLPHGGSCVTLGFYQKDDMPAMQQTEI